MELCYVGVHLYLNRALLKSCANATEIQDFSYSVTNFLFLPPPPFPSFLFTIPPTNQSQMIWIYYSVLHVLFYIE